MNFTSFHLISRLLMKNNFINFHFTRPGEKWQTFHFIFISFADEMKLFHFTNFSNEMQSLKFFKKKFSSMFYITVAFASSIHNKQQCFPWCSTCAAFSPILKAKCGNILVKAAALRINLNLDGATITSKSHTHPSYSQTSRLLTSSLSLGVPVPRPTQCVWGV
jgi:hypothetical protein